jgi:hypothetical protein
LYLFVPRLDKAQVEASELTDKARDLVATAKDAFRVALTRYRGACRKDGVECEFDGGRSAIVFEKVSFLVEKTDKGVRVVVKGKPKTEEVIPLAVLKESVNREAYRHSEAHIGPSEKVGNKGDSLSNRRRGVLQAKPLTAACAAARQADHARSNVVRAFIWREPPSSVFLRSVGRPGFAGSEIPHRSVPISRRAGFFSVGTCAVALRGFI